MIKLKPCPFCGKQIAEIDNCKNMEECEHFEECSELILRTCREGEMLQKAIDWCAEWELYFDAHNENLPELTEKYGNDCRKIGADYYCDDKNYWLMPEGD